MIAFPTQKYVVAFVSNSAWSVYNFRGDVIKSLIDQGFQVVAIAPKDEYYLKLENLGCRFVPVEFNNKKTNPFSDIHLYFKLKSIYSNIRPNFIFHYVIKPNIYGTLAARSLNIPSISVVTGLGYSFAKKNWLFRVVKRLYKHSLKYASEVWFLNNDDATVFLNEKISRINKIKVLPGEGINIAHFLPNRNRINQKKFTFLMSSRLLKSKGVGLYADAAMVLRKKNYDVQFDLLGFFEKNHPDSITEFDLAKWQEDGLIRYHGFVRDVRPFLKNTDCFVFPSYYREGIPRCLMEAASMEVPVITSQQRGCREVVLNNITGYLCQENNPLDLADKMEKMINLSDHDLDQMGKNGRQLMYRKFNVEQICDIYKQAISAQISISQPD